MRPLMLAAALVAAMVAAPAGARDFTIVSWGGAYQDAQREVYFRPFMQARGVRLLEESWDGGVGVLRAKIQSGANNWDVVQVETEELLVGCEEGLFERLDWSRVGARDAYREEAVHECGVGTIYWSFVLAYDRARITGEGPTSWADFWNVQRWPGKRSLRRGPKSSLEIALMADGVPHREVYASLRTDAGVERAFRKLEELRPHIVWWTAGSQPPQLLASGEVAMTSANFSTESGPMSGESQPSGMPSRATTLCSESAENSAAATRSTGRTILSPKRSRRSRQVSIISSCSRDFWVL